MDEIYRFVDMNSERLFVGIHRPARPPERAVVMVHPLGEEKLWSHRVFVSFARELAALGFAVLRFDFRGEGDSDREFQHADLETRVADTSTAIDTVRETFPTIKEVNLVGLRFGAIVAALASVHRADVARLILWDPILDGAAYMQAVLRLNLMFQMARYRKILENREQLVARLAKGETVNIEGYELPVALFRQTSAFRLQELLHRSTIHTLIVQVSQEDDAPVNPELSALAAACGSCRIEAIKEDAFWREITSFCQRAPALTRVTLDALSVPR